MWSEALSVLDRAQRLHQQFFTHAAAAWEPPVDVVESAGTLRVQVALPGVRADDVTIGLDPSGISISALRAFPCGGEDAHIHRVEIPYGRFERRIALPLERIELAAKQLEHGVLTLTFREKP